MPDVVVADADGDVFDVYPSLRGWGNCVFFSVLYHNFDFCVFFLTVQRYEKFVNGKW